MKFLGLIQELHERRNQKWIRRDENCSTKNDETTHLNFEGILRDRAVVDANEEHVLHDRAVAEKFQVQRRQDKQRPVADDQKFADGRRRLDGRHGFLLRARKKKENQENVVDPN